MVIPLLSILLLGVALLGTIENPGGDPGAIRARNATGGPVRPVTTREYIGVGLILALGVVCTFVGLFFMKR